MLISPLFFSFLSSFVIFHYLFFLFFQYFLNESEKWFDARVLILHANIYFRMTSFSFSCFCFPFIVITKSKLNYFIAKFFNNVRLFPTFPTFPSFFPLPPPALVFSISHVIDRGLFPSFFLSLAMKRDLRLCAINIWKHSTSSLLGKVHSRDLAE